MSKGKIITIQEYNIQLPDSPDDKSDVLFSNESKQNQYWRRQEFPRIFYDFDPRKTKAFAQETFYNSDGELVSVSENDSANLQRLLLRENRRRKEGVYAMINGELRWICPDYYYNLQWCQMKDLPEKYGRFRRVQNDFLTIWHWAKFVDWITSIILAKCKKSGITQILSGAFLNEGTYQTGYELLIASKDHPHAVSVAMAYLFHAFDNLPMIMQPTVKKRNLHEIIFGNPVNSISATAKRPAGKGLNTRISAEKTKPTCFDGPVVRRGWADEFPKWWESSKVSPKKAYTKMIETVKLQQKKNGLLVFSSYLPENDDQGYYEYRTLFYDSKIAKRDPITGQTPSGGIAVTMTALEANEDCFDIYGECDMIKADLLVTSEYNSKKSVGDKQAHRRQYPKDENDMFDSGGRGKTFDNIRLALQYREVEKELGTGILPYAWGDLRWGNSLWESGGKDNRRPQGTFAPVYLEELTEEQRIVQAEGCGTIKFFQTLPESMINLPLTRGNKNIEDGDMEPTDDDVLVASFDPTDYVNKSDVVQFSLNAGHGGFIKDANLEALGIKTDQLLFEYHFRHEDPDDTLEDVVKIIIYTGCRMIIEANKKWLITKIKKEGLHHYLLLKQKNGSIEPYREGDENDLVNTTVDLINAYCRAINKYWAKPKGNDPDMIETIKSLALLQHGMNFDVNNTRLYDLIVSFGYWRLAVEAFTVWITEKRKNSDYDSDAMALAADLLLG